MFGDGAFEGAPVESVRVRFTGRQTQGALELMGARVPEGEWAEAGPQGRRRLMLRVGTQGSDGGLIVGDSHHNEWSPSAFSDEAVYDLILGECQATPTFTS